MEFRNGIKVACGRGEAKISASIILQLTEITTMSATSGRCLSVTYDQRNEMCLDRFGNRFSFERATALSQSSYIVVGEV